MSLDVLERQAFAPGQALFRAGDAPRCAYLIQSGAVDIVVTRDGQDVVIDSLEPGGLVGEMALVDAEPRSATAVAKQATNCVVITRTDFARRLEKSDPFVRSMVKVLVRRLRKSTAA